MFSVKVLHPSHLIQWVKLSNGLILTLNQLIISILTWEKSVRIIPAKLQLRRLFAAAEKVGNDIFVRVKQLLSSEKHLDII